MWEAPLATRSPGSGGAGGSLHQGRRRGDDAGPLRVAGVAVADLDARVGAHEPGVDQADLAGVVDRAHGDVRVEVEAELTGGRGGRVRGGRLGSLGEGLGRGPLSRRRS